jgi:L-fucose isomerase
MSMLFGHLLTGTSQIFSCATTMDGTGKQKLNGKPAMKPYWEITPEEAGACLDATSWRYADPGACRT